MRIKEPVKAFLSFSKQDRTGIVSIVLFMGIIYVFPYLFVKRSEPFPARQTSVLVKAMDTLAAKQKQNHYQKNYDENDNDYQ
jgi:hypothetical protein